MRTRVVLMVAMWEILAGPARADPADTLGVSWNGRASAGAAAAGPTDAGAAWYNPAGLAFVERSTGLAGAVQMLSGLYPEDADRGSETFLTAAAAVPVLRVDDLPAVWLGVAAMLPAEYLYEMDLPRAEEPSFVLLNTRERRLSFSAAAGVRLSASLALGAGVELLPTVLALVDVDLTSATEAQDVHVKVGYRLSPLAGVAWRPHPAWKLGAAWRGENETPLRVPVSAVAQGITLDAEVAAQSCYVPHRVTAAAEWTFAQGWAVEADVTWYGWSGMAHPSPAVALYDAAGEDGLGAVPPGMSLRDTVSPAVALRWAGPFALTAGYRFTPSPVPAQTGRTNLLDGDWHTVAGGARAALSSTAGLPSRVSLYADAAVSFMAEQRLEKETVLVDNPGYPSLTYGGWRVVLGMGVEVEY